MKNLHPSSVSYDYELERIERERRAAIALMKDLDRTFKALPEGIPDSKSSTIEDLYARKEESVLKLKNQLRNLSHCKKTINEIVQKNNQRLGVLNDDKRALNTKKAKKKYSFAEFIQENKYRKVKTYQNDLNRVIECVQEAIKLADTRKFPGGNPQKKFRGLPPKAFSHQQSDIVSPPVIPPILVSPSIPSPATNQVNSLLSLGSLGK